MEQPPADYALCKNESCKIWVHPGEWKIGAGICWTCFFRNRPEHRSNPEYIIRLKAHPDWKPVSTSRFRLIFMDKQ